MTPIRTAFLEAARSSVTLLSDLRTEVTDGELHAAAGDAGKLRAALGSARPR